MLLDRVSIKSEAKDIVKNASVSAYLFTLLFLALSWLLAGMSDYVSLNEETVYNIYYATGVDLSFLVLHRAFPALLVTFITILAALLGVLLEIGYILYHLGIRRGREMPYLTLFDGFSFAGKVILLYIVQYIFIFLWSLLFIVPGIIAAYRYRFAFLILFDNETMTAREALNASKRMTVGYKSDLFRLDLSFIWYYVLLALPSIASSLALQGYFTIPDRLAVPIYLAETLYLSVIQILFMPYVATATAHLYNQVLAEQQGPAPEQDPRLSGEF